MKTKKLVICALFTAIMCITAPFYIMIGPVPITFTLFALALSAFTMGSLGATVSTAVYIAIGLVGMPVFSGFKGGFGTLMSPTGGFVFAYVLIALILGLCVRAKRKSTIVLLCGLALLVCYACGIIWYMLVTNASFITALWVCILPFIPFDIIKLYAAYFIAKKVKM